MRRGLEDWKGRHPQTETLGFLQCLPKSQSDPGAHSGVATSGQREGLRGPTLTLQPALPGHPKDDPVVGPLLQSTAQERAYTRP